MFISTSTENDFVPQTERRKSLRKSLRLSVNLSNSGSAFEDKLLIFIRGKQQRNISLGVYPKQGLLLQVLREEFSDNRLSYFYDPVERKELDYNGLWETTTKTILVLEDGDDVNAHVYAFQKGDSTFGIHHTNQ
ncbi:predicted protein [Naegleria gruberi]|uniref:Predicted protein n=1 Tax=Naegleria gruberi TaxID=5762 RepID=D2VKL0_NAEGR|nr:uncharacterized protein NAEGRDRAFT_69431 [Naegleria gruberi]EFC42613.1 predicted protein [Naegleria gruberi]|eukprot:XP_002675357.1 predicted protein [Naegleria gruberi strain NEG-M]